MLPREVLAAHRSEVLELARTRGASHVRVFGSVARGEDHQSSDIDVRGPGVDDRTRFGYRIQQDMDRSRSRFEAGDPANPAWRRYQAWSAVSSFATGIRLPDGWLHVRNALDDAWAVVREQLIAALTQQTD